MDTSAGPFKNYTVVFLGSDNGHVLKILTSTEGANASFSTQLLEDIDVYNPNKSVSTPRSLLSSFRCLSRFIVVCIHFQFLIVSCPSFSIFLSLFPVLRCSSPPLSVLPWSVLPTHSWLYCNIFASSCTAWGDVCVCVCVFPLFFFLGLLLFSDCVLKKHHSRLSVFSSDWGSRL